MLFRLHVYCQCVSSVLCTWCELQHVNASYKTNLQKLNSLVLVMFENDTMVEPRESEVSSHCVASMCIYEIKKTSRL